MKTRYVIQHSSDNKTWYDVCLEDEPGSFGSRREAVDVMNELASHDDHQGWMRVVPTCEFFIVQARVYTSLDKPRKFRWEHMMCADFSEHGDSELVKRFETREQAEKGIRRYIRKHCQLMVKYFRLLDRALKENETLKARIAELEKKLLGPSAECLDYIDSDDDFCEQIGRASCRERVSSPV